VFGGSFSPGPGSDPSPWVSAAIMIPTIVTVAAELVPDWTRTAPASPDSNWSVVAGGDLDVAQVDAGVEHGGHEGVAQHVRTHPR
jgi:hypothetical protein